jgi:pimeloyl-ACP methyl ester carboxylesterase
VSTEDPSPDRTTRLHTGARGLWLAVHHWGPEAGRPVVILHGFLEQGPAWGAVARALAPRRVVAPDHRGHGRSGHVGAGGFYHFWDYVADVDALLDALGEGPVDLVGHSMGGTLAVLVAACVPEKVRRLVLVEGLGPPDGSPRALEQARAALRHRRRPPRHRPVDGPDDAVQRMRKGNPDLPAHRAPDLARHLIRPAGETWSWTWDPLHRARSPQAFSAAGFRTFLAAVEAPVLLVDGATSPYQHIPDLDDRRAALQDARVHTLADTGHHPHHTCPAVLADLIREHLDGS